MDIWHRLGIRRRQLERLNVSHNGAIVTPNQVLKALDLLLQGRGVFLPLCRLSLQLVDILYSCGDDSSLRLGLQRPVGVLDVKCTIAKVLQIWQLCTEHIKLGLQVVALATFNDTVWNAGGSWLRSMLSRRSRLTF